MAEASELGEELPSGAGLAADLVELLRRAHLRGRRGSARSYSPGGGRTYLLTRRISDLVVVEGIVWPPMVEGFGATGISRA